MSNRTSDAVTIQVTPAKGRRVRDLSGAVVPAKGKTYPAGSYWRRREADGDVTITPVPNKSARQEANEK